MAVTLTTLTGALGANDSAAYFAALTNLVAGDLGTIDHEVVRIVSVPAAASNPVPLLRGQEGTAQVAHPSGAQAKFGKGPTAASVGDWQPSPAAATSLAAFPSTPAREVISYSASGAIALPRPGCDMVAVLNGTTILNMTVASPNMLADGSRLTIVSNGKAAHVVTVATGAGGVGGTADGFTFKADQTQGIEFMGVGTAWVALSGVAGAATLAGVGIA